MDITEVGIYVTIGVAIAGIGARLWNTGIDWLFNKLTNRLLEKRLDSVEKGVLEKFQQFEEKFITKLDGIEKHFSQKFNDIEADILYNRILKGIDNKVDPNEVKKDHARYMNIPTADGKPRNGYISWRVDMYVNPITANREGYYTNRHNNECFNTKKEGEK